MNLYNKHVLPKLVNIACSSSRASKQREKIIPAAEGCVLEIGIGSGLNIPFYDSTKVQFVWGLDPSAELWALADPDEIQQPFEVKHILGYAHQIPLEDKSVDTVVMTYTLCSIQKVSQTMSELRRVLSPGGKVLFCEHGLAPDRSVQRWQNVINPAWKKIGGGCNLNRHIPSLFSENGFTIEKLETMYIPGWRPACYNYWGVARI